MKAYHGFAHTSGIEKIIFICLIVLILILPFDEGGNGYILQFITQMALLFCGTLWTIRAMRRGHVTIIWDWFDLLIAGGVVWTLISVALASYKYAALLELIKIASYLVFFYACRIFFPLKDKQTLLLCAILCSSLIQLVVALYSYLSGQSPILQAGFVNPNNLACLWVIGLAVVLSRLLFFQASEKQSGEPGYIGKQHTFSLLAYVLYVVALIGLGIAVFQIRSRGAVVSLAVIGFFLATLRKKILGGIVLVAIAVILMIPTPWGSVLQRLQKQDDPYAYERIGIWKSDIRMIADHPVFGVGLGMFPYYARAYNFPLEHRIARYEKNMTAAHNAFLHVGTESGIVGLLIFLTGMAHIGFYTLRHCRQARRCSWQVIASSAGILAILVQGMVSTLITSPAITMMMVVFVAILLDSAQTYRSTSIKFSPVSGWHSLHSWLRYGILLLLLIYLVIPAIGYPLIAHRHYLKYKELRQAREIGSAVEHLQQAIRYVPMQAYYHETLGSLYLTAFRNNPDLDAFYEGYQAFTEAIRHHPREFDFYLKLAELHRAMFYQRLRTKPTAQNALREYQTARTYNPFNPFILLSMATLYADIQEFDTATTLLEQAIDIEPNFVGAHQMLGRLWNHLQQAQKARAAFNQAEIILSRYGAEREGETEYVQSLLRPLF